MGRSRRRTPELRERFVHAAVASIESGRLEDLTTRGVATACGSSLAALNELFGGKAGLINAVALHGFGLLADALGDHGSRSDPTEELIAVCRVHHRFVVENPELAQLMFSRPYETFEPRDVDAEMAAVIRRAFTDPVGRLVGEDRSDDAVTDASVGLVALVEGLARHHRGGVLGSNVASAERRFLVAVTTYLDGLTPEASAPG